MNAVRDKIKQLRNCILVHSCVYYKYNDNLISDYKFDEMGRKLVKLQKEYPKISRETELYNEFKDYGVDGCFSGYNLPYNSVAIDIKARYLISRKEFINDNE